MFNFKFINSRLVYATKSLCLKLNSPQIMVSRNCTIRRAILYVPCKDRRKIEKALSLKVDCIAFDLQTTVEEEQVEARTAMHNLLNEGKVTVSDPEWCVKVNPIQTGSVFKSDIDAALTAKRLPAGIILPEVDSVDLLLWFTEQIWKKLIERPEGDRGPIQLLLTIASARGVMLLRDICEKVMHLATMAPILPSAIIFNNMGVTDSLGCIRTSHGIEYLYARQKTVLVAKAFGLQAIDIPNTNPTAVEELEKECREGCFMGYTGKQALFPLQVPIIHKEFTPSRTKVIRAKVIISEMSKRDLTEMEDYAPDRIPTEDPVLKLARHTLHTAKFARKIEEE